jgi:hypothetical protein
MIDAAATAIGGEELRDRGGVDVQKEGGVA